MLVFLTIVSVSCLQTKDPSAGSVQETTKALVDIQSVNATVVAGQPQGYVHPATGEVYISQRFVPVSYSRSGSGIIIDPKGIIVTNAHTISGAGGLAVTLFNGQNAPVKQAHLVPGTDLAFLKIDPPFPLASIPLANSDRVVRGINVYAIGHSNLLKGTLIGGKIAGIQWEKKAGVPHATAIQLNFDMAQGDSGCPILDGKGRLLGMVGATLEGSGGTTIAIPSNSIAAAYQDYLKTPGKKS